MSREFPQGLQFPGGMQSNVSHRLACGGAGLRALLDAIEALDDVQLRIGESFRITPGTVHHMVAVTDCDVLEVSTPELDDVVRLSDKYGRTGTSAP